MKVMRLYHPGQPLRLADLPRPEPGPGQLRVKIAACGVCRTDLHILDGELTQPKLPLVPGHEVIGQVDALGPGVSAFPLGARVGIPWLGWTCGQCSYCLSGRENLCDRPQFTGYQIDGGYGDYALADARYCFPIPERYSDLEAAPLMCAGLIGYRALKKAGDGRRIGIYGFGAAAHIVAQIAVFEGRSVYAFTRPGDLAAQSFARDLGAVWVGGSDLPPPEPLDAALLFAPVGALVPQALRVLRKGGRVVAAGIHMSDIPSFPYDILWPEREIVAVANLTRQDALEFLELAPRIPVRTHVVPYAIDQANEALDDLRSGQLTGAAVLSGWSG